MDNSLPGDTLPGDTLPGDTTAGQKATGGIRRKSYSEVMIEGVRRRTREDSIILEN